MNGRKFAQCLLLILSVIELGGTQALWAQPPTKAKAGSAAELSFDTIFLADCSGSVAEFDPPDTIRACILHSLDLQRLASRPGRTAVIVFGQEGIRVFAGENGLPTAAHATLRQQLLKEWPAPEGATPLDMAFEEALRMLRACDTNSRKTVVLFGDGIPASGKLRPDDFPKIAAEMAKHREVLHSKYSEFPDNIVQEMIARQQRAWELSGTDEFDQLYTVQQPLEFEQTLKHAAALKSLQARLVTVDFTSGVPELRQIHHVAGGIDDDILTVLPNDVIRALGELRLTTMPDVIRQSPVDYEAQPTQTAGEYRVDIPSLADRALATIEFQPAIADFHQRAILSCEVDGQSRQFNADNHDADLALGYDAKGNVAIASVFLSRRPDSGHLVFRLESPDGTMSTPKCSVYSYIRLSDELRPVLRPRFVSSDTPAPYLVTPQQKSEWVFTLLSSRKQQSGEFSAVEAVLTNVRSGIQVRLEMKPDSTAAGQFTSTETSIPSGRYDAEVFVTTATGVRLSLVLNSLVISTHQNGVLLVDYPVVADESGQGYSQSTLHLDFGTVGDDVIETVIPISLSARGLSVPLTVIPRVYLSDAEGNVPEGSWIQVRPGKVVVRPDGLERISLRIQLPDRIEEDLVDGLFEGRIEFEDPDSGLPVTIERFRDISGVEQDTPVNRITFNLHRPRIFVSSVRCFREAVQQKRDGVLQLPVNVSIGKRFERALSVTAWHDSVIPRELTMIPPDLLRDTDGREVPNVRFVPLQESLTQTVAPGESVTWDLRFEADDDQFPTTSDGELTVTANQLKDTHVEIRVRERNSLLGDQIQIAAYIAATMAACLGLMAFWHWRRVSRLVTASAGYLNPSRSLAPVLSVESGRKGEPQLRSDFQMLRKTSGKRLSRRIPAGRPLVLESSQISSRQPLELSIEPHGMTKSVVLQIPEVHSTSDEPPEVEYEVIDGGGYDQQSSKASGSLIRRILAVICCLTVAIWIHTGPILRSCQWVFDLVTAS